MVAVADTYSNTFVLPKHDPLFEESQSPGMFWLVNNLHDLVRHR